MSSAENTSMSGFSEENFENTTTVKVDNNCPPDAFRQYYYTLGGGIYFYGLLVIIPFGMIGNIITVCVFLLSAVLRRTTTGQYLIALAIADTTVLIGDAIRWLATRRHNAPLYYIPQYMGLNFVDYSDVACKVTNFIRYGGNLWSVWLTIAISLERLIAVALPLKIGRISTRRTTRVTIIGIGLVSFSLGSFPFWTLYAGNNPTCGVPMPHCRIYNDAAYNAWNTVVVKFLTVVIPGCLIVVITVVIIALLFRARNKRKVQLNVSQRQTSQQQREGITRRVEVSMETQLTMMLVAVCVSTIALRSPYTIAYYYRSAIWNGNYDPVREVQTFVALKVTEVFNVVNYAINFILYCLSGSSFRGEARKIFCRRWEEANRSSALVTEEVCLNDMKRKSGGHSSTVE